MPYQWPVDARGLFQERYPQMINGGLPASDVDAVRRAVDRMWADSPGGWCYEWSALARDYAEAGLSLPAALAYGWAKFPTPADESRRIARARQLEQYALAAPAFDVDFERRVVDTFGAGRIPVHLFARPGLAETAPLLLVSGGVDRWKMDLHALWVRLAMHTSCRVLAFDIAGTGESAAPMTPDGGMGLVRALIRQGREWGSAVAHLGMSMGGYYSAYSGLLGEVDAAVVVGGPVERAFTVAGPRPHGMDDIIGNALGFESRPPADVLAARLERFSLRHLLDREVNAPMLIVNGADDIFVPRHDTTVFRGREATEVHLIPDAGHCAVSKFSAVVRILCEWLGKTLHRRGR